jgi:mono/diheme cytochrome c family protein
MALVLLLSLVLSGCEWFSDFKAQPKVEPWEAEFTMRDSAGKWVTVDTIGFPGALPNSVPMEGTPLPAFVISYTPAPATIDSMSSLPNPVPMSRASVELGRRYFQINCAVCHGPGGAGNGPAVRFGVVAPSLLTPITRGRTDGYIWGIIRNGRGLMPTYDRIEDTDRWHVVNYVRALQGTAGMPADTAPAGYPGQTGATLPGATTRGPTRSMRDVAAPGLVPGAPTRADSVASPTSTDNHE